MELKFTASENLTGIEEEILLPSFAKSALKETATPIANMRISWEREGCAVLAVQVSDETNPDDIAKAFATIVDNETDQSLGVYQFGKGGTSINIAPSNEIPKDLLVTPNQG